MFTQFPQRDEVAMSDVAGMEQPGWSNRHAVRHDDEPADAAAEEKAIAPAEVEDKSVKPARKTATARKG